MPGTGGAGAGAAGAGAAGGFLFDEDEDFVLIFHEQKYGKPNSEYRGL